MSADHLNLYPDAVRAVVVEDSGFPVMLKAVSVELTHIPDTTRSAADQHAHCCGGKITERPLQDSSDFVEVYQLPLPCPFPRFR